MEHERDIKKKERRLVVLFYLFCLFVCFSVFTLFFLLFDFFTNREKKNVGWLCFSTCFVCLFFCVCLVFFII